MSSAVAASSSVTSSPSSSQTTALSTDSTPLTVLLQSSSTPTPTPTPTPGGQGNGSNLTSSNSAALYLYTFLATLVLLLSVSAAIVIRSFVLRRRDRRMREEAIRNGTWVPQAPATRSPRVDLSKKPVLWEAFLGDGGWQVGGIRGLEQGGGKELGISTNWKFENLKDWESIKPVCVDYVGSKNSIHYSASTTTLDGTLSPPVAAPVTPANPSTPRGEQENQDVSPALSLFIRARMFLNPTPYTHPLPTTFPSAGNATNANLDPTNMPMTELGSSSPTTLRVAVLIAMPSPPPSSHGSSTALSNSFSSSSSTNLPKPITSHPLQIPPSQTCTAHDEEPSLPQLEVGVAEVVLGASENPTSWDSTHRRHGKNTYSRGSSFVEP